ncbi:pyridoxamine 5'-phosphate oxidase family protein [Iamia sp. SCSIO 61187]|uniref:pyridoxamine 5'-phosphate oxidase family protein n=1 Tax=Iamia sp. SCSIO 61187 TaxID=2722752 RepID=UPI001C62C424|nr:pyridoxamine 5'-phosphate oxidase family protein [Iamia sp. SCSIO 61187]QYG95039.1 pyridoxamine 5'-phosphate oxidase family protein [Iamia sp. SCSIO 61187]
MRAPTMLTAEDRTFLAGPRLGFLTVASADARSPHLPVPVWFEPLPDGVQLVTGARSAKVRRLRARPQASLVAANHLDEPEHWVAVAGPVTLHDDGAPELTARLAGRYWDLDDPERAATLEAWRSEEMVRVVIRAEVLRRGE